MLPVSCRLDDDGQDHYEAGLRWRRRALLRLALFADDGQSPLDLALPSSSLPCVSHPTPGHACLINEPAVPCSVDAPMTPYVATFLGVECAQVTMSRSLSCVEDICVRISLI